jgi:hypothetical protein
MIEIQFDYHLFLVLLVLYYLIIAFANIIVGALEVKKSTSIAYGPFEVLWGIGFIVLILFCVFF